jgi:hypothetical protein
MNQAETYNVNVTYPGYQDSTREYIKELFQKGRAEEAQRKLSTAIHNPKTGWIHLMDPSYRLEDGGSLPWDKYPRVINTKRYNELVAKSAAGQVNEDQATYGFYANEWQDEALRAHSAGTITSTEFPAITVTSVQNELLRLDTVTAEKYNLLGLTEVFNTDKILVSYPEYNDTTKRVRTGYKENDPIETIGFGAFTEQILNLEKSGAGVSFTEEYYMREYKFVKQ